ncbi:MAG: membrane protein insertase YidC [Saprospiraceae bacterium]|nr:membrane protein insertase YidC [Saprospiraceae bacterium]MCB9322366.1 membrane protein insertase YidC [Lewinellaceae bacterium]
MDRNTIIGLVLIFIMLVVYQQVTAPSQEQLEAQKRYSDSIALVEQKQAESSAQIKSSDSSAQEAESNVPSQVSDSLLQLQMAGAYGPFSTSANGSEKESVIENDLMKITFTNKGGKIKQVQLKHFSKALEDEEGKEVKIPLLLLEDEKNKFEYFLPIANLPAGGVKTSDLYFEATAESKKITFRAMAANGGYFEQSYTLKDGSYDLDYDIKFENLNTIISGEAQSIKLSKVNFLDKIERSVRFEKTYSTVHFKKTDDDPDNCSWTSSDKETPSGQIKWMADANQFFSSILVADQAFTSGVFEIETLGDEMEDLKIAKSEVNIPFNHASSETFGMSYYIGPNDFDILRQFDDGQEDIVAFGRSILGTINRWVIRPIFNFLQKLVGNMGIAILLLTLLVKLLLYPLTYKMLYSQSKMQALKPRMEKMKEKYKDDKQAQQMETMKLYQEYGANPLGGCMPMVMQMPIWFALYRFFPAAIEFRQQSFLWATDLSTYDSILHLPFSVPLGFGNHVSLLTILWAVSMLVYTYYNSKHMDMSANPAMKYMQYIMPVMFLGFFNSYASGLTTYLLFSNLLNIAQTVITKNYIIDQDKIQKELEAFKQKPKKKSGFRERLSAAMEEQQKQQAAKDKKKK